MSNTLSMYINFDGNCREAVQFYAKVFKSEVRDIMTYDEMPSAPDFPLDDADWGHIVNCTVPIFGSDIMFCDVPSSMPLTKGDNISPTLNTDDKDEIRRIYTELSEEGEILMALDQTFWSELYGMVQDKYGIIWQIAHHS